MTIPGPLRVLYDSAAFIEHFRSGTTRYFAELISEYRRQPLYQVEPVTPFRYVVNSHLVDRVPGTYRWMPLPARVRQPVFDRLDRKTVAECGPVDIVHHTLYVPDHLDQYSVAKRVCMIHDFTAELMPEIFGRYQEQIVREKNLFIDACDALFCNSENTRRDLTKFHPDLDKPVFVTPLGVGSQFFTPRKTRKVLPQRYLLHVGSRHAHKNVDILFQAMAHLAPTNPDLRLVLLGAAPPGESDRLKELGIYTRTIRLRSSDRDLPWIYANAGAFVFPSLYEGFGLPVIEAMAAGCPTVVADTPALVEVAGDAAKIFQPNDVDVLVETLESILGDPQRAATLRESGKLRAHQFTWPTTARKTAAAYHQVRTTETRMR